MPVLDNPGQGPCYFTSLCSSSEHGNDGHDGSLELILNTKTLFTKRNMSYFTRVLPSKYCNYNIPELDRIGIYSFSLEPFNLQPSGTMNFSTIESGKKMRIKIANIYRNKLKNRNLHIFAINYNIFRIIDGQGGLAYD